MPTSRLVASHPRDIGQFAAFFAGSENFARIKDFNWLRSRLLLARQLEFAELQRRLLDPDHEIVVDDPGAVMSWKLPEENELLGNMKSLLSDIDLKLKDYGQGRNPKVQI